MEWGTVICSIVGLGFALLAFVSYCEGKIEKMTTTLRAVPERNVHAA
ncbi:MAG TPA: hypothetical protein PLG17_07465 [Thermodesulfobacteriota bacterium]|nr:hypothetical protein [Thermodesulfobacteriota bacterium]HNU70996.1 hypothetical protein [Thermodesulfobacteriota bacterium]HOC39452.1 hypothetical protein [Thermodesulfobacteriota bacterium]HQO78335.1 hypothetical protein [Thermodesulfobacteriota bacterium]